MEKLIVGFLLLLAAHASMAQAEDEGNGGKIAEYKINYITKKITLTPEQSKQFWPVYTEFDKERREIRLSIRDIKRAENKNANEEQSKENLKNIADLKQKEAGLEKKYLEKFLKVVGPEQVKEMQRAERDFNREIVKVIQERREARQHLQNNKEKATEQRQNNREKNAERVREHRQNMRDVKPKN